ncbi:MAG TPA: FMN-binding protein [Acidobacteriota bacterium]|nr:FMN-binding protein [Acidobacteriota bacterium]
MREVIRLVVVLTVICGVSAGALTLVRQSLGSRIEQQSDFYVRGPALERLFGQPSAELLDKKVSFTSDGRTYPVFYTRDGEQITGLAVEAPGPGGYGGDVVVMIGVDLRAGQMVGMEIIQHNETPGVGSQVERPAFRKQWSGLSVSEPVQLTAQGGKIDAISGATYSSKAVINGTNAIVELLGRHRDEIMASIRTKEGQS